MHKWDNASRKYPDIHMYKAMTNTAQFTGFSFEAAENGICTIQPIGKISVDMASTVARRVVTHISQYGLPTGLLLDVSHTAHLSIVRLSSLIDTLSGMGVPLAVLFGEREQQMLADLLYNTLVQKDYVAYFTDPEQARAYLLTSATRNTPPDPQ
jgi:hypothetical protein